MAQSDNRAQYSIWIDKEFKTRLDRLPFKRRRSLAEPMRAALEKLVAQAEKKNGKD